MITVINLLNIHTIKDMAHLIHTTPYMMANSLGFHTPLIQTKTIIINPFAYLITTTLTATMKHQISFYQGAYLRISHIPFRHLHHRIIPYIPTVLPILTDILPIKHISSQQLAQLGTGNALPHTKLIIVNEVT